MEKGVPSAGISGIPPPPCRSQNVQNCNFEHATILGNNTQQFKQEKEQGRRANTNWNKLCTRMTDWFRQVMRTIHANSTWRLNSQTCAITMCRTAILNMPSGDGNPASGNPRTPPPFPRTGPGWCHLAETFGARLPSSSLMWGPPDGDLYQGICTHTPPFWSVHQGMCPQTHLLSGPYTKEFVRKNDPTHKLPSHPTTLLIIWGGGYGGGGGGRACKCHVCVCVCVSR